MLAALFVVLANPVQSKPTLICEIKSNVLRSFISCSVLTDKETVAGYMCESVGNHGETFFAKPFVWSKGKLTILPLPPKVEYGHVLGGNDQTLVGSVTFDYRERPAMWTADSKLGWAKPSLKVLAMKDGLATHIEKDRTIWIQFKNKVVAKITKGRWKDVSLGSFQLQGFDGKGRMYGNQFKGMHFGGGPATTVPSLVEKGAFTKLPTFKRLDSFHVDDELEDVNPKGIAVGTVQNQAAIWRDGKLELPLGKKERWSRAIKINDLGDVIGYCSVGEADSVMTFLWQNGKVFNLANWAPGIEINAVQNLNNRGAVAVMVTDRVHTKLYLIRTQ